MEKPFIDELRLQNIIDQKIVWKLREIFKYLLILFFVIIQTSLDTFKNWINKEKKILVSGKWFDHEHVIANMHAWNSSRHRTNDVIVAVTSEKFLSKE